MRDISIKIQQNWDNLTGVTEKARAELEIYFAEDGISINGCKGRFDETSIFMQISKEDAIFIAKQLLAFYQPSRE